MMSTSQVFTLPLTTMATLLAVVACGPTKDYVPVQAAAPTIVNQAFADCRDGLAASKAVVVSATTKVCEIGANGNYGWVEHKANYDIQKRNGDLRLHLKVSTVYVDGIAKEIKDQVSTVITESCLPEINKVFNRSIKAGGVGVDINVSSDPQPTGQAQDPFMQLQLVPSTPEVTIVMANWADRARLYPFGLKKDIDVCNQLPTPIEQSRCRWSKVREANMEFCSQMAVATGHWLALPTPRGSESHCKDETPETTTTTTPATSPSKPTLPGDVPYMKGAHDLPPTEFFSKASLSRADLKTISSPACASFRALPAEFSYR